VTVDGFPGRAHIGIAGLINPIFLVFFEQVPHEHLDEAFAAAEMVASVGITLIDGSHYLRSAIVKDFSEPLAVTNSLQALAIAKLNFDGRLLPESG
jgi:hypothetical protein